MVTETVVVVVPMLSEYLLVQVDLLVALSNWQVVIVSAEKPVPLRAGRGRRRRRSGTPALRLRRRRGGGQSARGAWNAPPATMAIGAPAASASDAMIAMMLTRGTRTPPGRRIVYVQPGRGCGINERKSGRSAAW